MNDDFAVTSALLLRTYLMELKMLK